ncbi:hypothetical protein MTR15_02315, partial [Escherichia coli]|nr:hypothetical protein [Escherichia coli]MCT6298067.1 hypothetical protein [Escherichia coli]MCT6307175.1 hypothetical protein [Escherichia coli]
MIHAFIKKGCFQDSVSLMIISRKLSESENVDDVSVMMGTPANKALLDTTGFWHDDFNNATPNDICVAIRSEAADAGIAQAIMQQLEEALKQLAQGAGSSQALMNPLMILVKIIKLRWIHILSYDQMVSRKINNQ